MVSQLEAPLFNSHQPLPYSIEGIVQVFTCAHRSFFTNVIAQALRIAGQGTPVLVVQFLKGGIGQGPHQPVQLGQHLDWLRCDMPECIASADVEEATMAALHQLWHYTKSVVTQGKYALVVLDELSLAIEFNLIPEAEVLELLEHRPRSVDVILTGPAMPRSILDRADQITELRYHPRS
ncbi:MAG: P-loop NTPase family protein [Leptolyngbyaceae cyanobacterium SL_7_1]|nr:P-loop NTPase family protein [Leptolyngbyaceae cyanobacterium SL_7_1]